MPAPTELLLNVKVSPDAMRGRPLQERLCRLFPAEMPDDVFVGVTVGGEHFAAAIGKSAQHAERVGCIAKLLTAALLRQTVSAGVLSFDSRLGVLLPGILDDPDAAEIRVLDLINHTHGLDDSHMNGVPLQSDGCIDSEALCASLLAGPKLAQPSVHYSYGNAGAWLGAAVLEAAHRRSYAELLESNLLHPLGIVPKFGTPRPGGSGLPLLCPAFGRRLRFACEDMLRFLDQQMGDSQFGFAGRAYGEILENTSALPGWHSTERGLYFGWKHYGAGWFGHNSEVPQSGMLLRINPARRIGVVVASARFPPTKIARDVLHEDFPDLITLQMPRLRASKTLDVDEARLLAGDYGNRSARISISLNERNELQLDAAANDGGNGGRNIVTTPLRPAENAIFFLQNPAAELSPYVQFVALRDGVAQALWDGMRVLPRLC